MSNPTWWHAVQRKAGSHLLPPSDDLHFVALALAGEAGELANLVKKEWRGDADARGSHWSEKVNSEICDVAAYAFMAACVQGFDLLDETYRKLEAVEQRPEFKALVAAAKINKMLGPLPPSELAKMQEKGEECVPVTDANWNKLAAKACGVATVAIPQAKYIELVDKAFRYDQLSR